MAFAVNSYAHFFILTDLGTEDAVRCFACDVGLRRWDPEDDPWIEHCRWFPQCPYCVEQKGIQYITLIQALDELVCLPVWIM